MSKKSFTILITILSIIILSTFGYIYFKRAANPPDGSAPGTNFLSQFNPFKQNSQPPTNSGEPTDTPGTEQPGENAQINLLKVSSMPIAGYTVYLKERFKEEVAIAPGADPAPATTPIPPSTEFVPNVRYVARATGNIYQTFADKIDERKFSETVIPKIYESYFGAKGESVIMRFLKANDRTIATFAGTLPKEFLGLDSAETNEVKGSFLPDNISDMSISPDGINIFYLLNIGGSATGITASPVGDKKVQVFDSPFTEWLSFWPNSKMITLTTKASGGVPGYMYAIDPNKKDLNKILGDINGLTTLTSPTAKLVLYADNNLSLNIYNIDTREIVSTTVRTLPEKCVWNKGGTAVYCVVPKVIEPGLYPDLWYQGETSFSDDIWKIDAVSGIANLILDLAPVVGGEGLDGIKLALDEGENYLFFVNKKDSFLWEIKLK